MCDYKFFLHQPFQKIHHYIKYHHVTLAVITTTTPDTVCPDFGCEATTRSTDELRNNLFFRPKGWPQI